MKKNKLFIFTTLLLGLMVITSCSTEEEVLKETSNSFEYSKTTEMLNFEKQLKIWFSSKNETDLNKKTDLALETEKVTKELMVSFGNQPIEFSKMENKSTDEYIRLAMREYSKQLKTMYNQQSK